MDMDSSTEILTPIAPRCFIVPHRLKVYQFNAPHASVFERLRASEIVNQDLKVERDELDLIIIDGEEELLACAEFWAGIGGPAPASLPSSEDSRAVVPQADDVDLTQPKKLYKISDEAGSIKLSLAKESSELSVSDVNENDVWAIVVDGRAYFYIGDAASYMEKVSVRFHMPSLLETMQLPTFAPTTMLSPGKNPVWDTIF
eukprot:IDg17869t1